MNDKEGLPMTDDIYKVFGEKVRELRETAGLSQGELADMAGIYQTELSAFEKQGAKIRGADKINKILSALGYELQPVKKKLLLA